MLFSRRRRDGVTGMTSGAGSKSWRVSLHGGHSGEFCDHATGTLREVLDAAVEYGYETFGVTEHAPRYEERYLYDTERERGWTIFKIIADFHAYALASATLAAEYADRLTVLRGFEIEVIPANYQQVMQDLRRKYAFDYVVGSVHFLHDLPIDGPRAQFDQVLELEGGLERTAKRYYERVAEMVTALRPEVVGHLDLIRRNAPSNEAVETPVIKRAALEALAAIRDCGGILDVNTAGYRKGLGSPYPAPWLVHEATARGVGLCFGDDSHGPEQVGAGVEMARDYLIELGVQEVTVLRKVGGEVRKEQVSLM